MVTKEHREQAKQSKKDGYNARVKGKVRSAPSLKYKAFFLRGYDQASRQLELGKYVNMI